MIAILDNLISVLALQVGFTLGNIIYFLGTPFGIVIIVSWLVYLEYATIKSIIKDPNAIIVRMVTKYMQTYALKNTPLTSYQLATLNVIFKKKNIGIKDISNIIGVPIIATRKLVNGLINNGYVMRSVNIGDKRTFVFATSHKYKEQGIYP